MQLTLASLRLTRDMKAILATAFAIGLASMPVEQVTACSCAPFTPEEAADAADAVFAGTVVRASPVGMDAGPLGAVAATTGVPSPLGGTIFTFAVDGVAKGPVGTQADVLAGGDGGTCGMSFGLNERWLVFTTWDGAIHRTGLCSGNLLLEAGAEPPLALTPPEGGETEADASVIPMPMVALFGVIALVLAVSWVAFRRGPAHPA